MMMSEKSMSMPLVNRIAPRVDHAGRPAIVSLVARLFAPDAAVRSRQRAAQASLEEAVTRRSRGSPAEEEK
jgi:hypothetical protein